MRRIFFSLLLIAAIAPATWLREELPPRNHSSALRFEPQPLPPPAELARHLGPFRLEAAWRMVSPNSFFGSYSALVALPDGRLIALSDRGYRLHFSPPGAPPSRVLITQIRPETVERVMVKAMHDAESATFDPAGGHVWVGWESTNSISRQSLDFGEWQEARPRAMRDWGNNYGPEAMARLADGRFVVLREGFEDGSGGRVHRGVIFAGDPLTNPGTSRFTFSAASEFSPTDMAQMPDGRVLILMRKLLWPFPARFAGRLVLADPALIREGGEWRGEEVALLSSSLPVDNFEGLAIAPRGDGRLTVWLISDDNSAALQRTMLWKLVVDPADLPGQGGTARSKKARGKSARPQLRRD